MPRPPTDNDKALSRDVARREAELTRYREVVGLIKPLMTRRRMTVGEVCEALPAQAERIRAVLAEFCLDPEDPNEPADSRDVAEDWTPAELAQLVREGYVEGRVYSDRWYVDTASWADVDRGSLGP